MVLLKVLRKTRQREREIRILMLGLDNAGKTTAVKKFNGEDVDSVSPTLGFEIKSFEFKSYQLNVWDVGGQKTLRAYWRNYFDETDGIIWVVDSADTGRMDDCREELKALLQEQRLAGATLLIFANKQDIKGAQKPSQIRKILELDSMSESRHWRVEGCSAVTGSGLLSGIEWLVSDIAARVFLLD